VLLPVFNCLDTTELSKVDVIRISPEDSTDIIDEQGTGKEGRGCPGRSFRCLLDEKMAPQRRCLGAPPTRRSG